MGEHLENHIQNNFLGCQEVPGHKSKKEHPMERSVGYVVDSLALVFRFFLQQGGKEQAGRRDSMHGFVIKTGRPSGSCG